MMRKRSDRARARTSIPLPPSLVLPLLAVFSLAGCGGGGPLTVPTSLPSLPSLSEITHGFSKPAPKLPGKRISVLQSGNGEEGGKFDLASDEAPGPVVLPPPVANASWAEPGGVPSNAPGHLVLAATLKTAWTASGGTGSSKRARLTAIPIVYDNKVFTLDADGKVSATALANGDSVWSVSLLPKDDKLSFTQTINPFLPAKNRAGYGGGLAADGGKLFAATGFGTVVALDPASGKTLWTKKMEIPIRLAPTAVDGHIFVVDSESEVFCLNEADGSEQWSSKGLPAGASLLNSSSPAVSGNLVFVPYPSGEVAALDVKTGQAKWTESLGLGDTNSSGTAIGDAARPVVDRDVVFAMSRGGQMIASSKEKGDRLWSREMSGSQTPWVAGDTVFAVDVSGNLLALDRKNGKVRWLTSLPSAGLWSGPVLAGGKLWLVSSTGMLLSVDAVSGNVSGPSWLGATVTIPPIVADGKLIVFTDKAKLIAMN